MLDILPNTLLISNSEGLHVIPFSEIIRLQGRSNYTEIICQDRIIVFSRTLKSILDEIDSDFFVRVHKAHVINLRFIRLKTKNEMKMSNGDTVPLSRKSYAFSNMKVA